MNLTASDKFVRLRFSELPIGKNFHRGDGVNGGSFDKISATRAKRCSLDGSMKPIAFAADAKVLVGAGSGAEKSPLPDVRGSGPKEGW
jgi:hypothetical protein